ncbi:MAG TPA: dehydrogenase [Phycisphaerales bacterium]|nr:dehydrogenase [Phycisphaerales bacterium]
MSDRKRYAVVGLGSRSSMFTRALYTDYAKDNALVAFCDINQTRMDYYNNKYQEEFGIKPVPTYKPDQFEQMITDHNIDCVIVTSKDCTHHEYICRAMEAGCDAISEKPMTTDAAKCQQILDTQVRTGKKLTVTFNYRYAPRNSKVRELIQAGEIGDVHSVHFEWLLNTKHGADYFRRWHRDKANSGGLMVHKSTHHFDLVNWWIGADPVKVFALGGLKYYGQENAQKRGVTEFYERAHGNPVAAKDPFAIDMENNKELKGLYLDAEHEDGYIRDQSVFGKGINIEDDMAVLVGYNSGATMSYHLTAYSPWEGYRVAFNGSKGRLELTCMENAYVSGSDDDHNMARNVSGSSPYEVKEPTQLILQHIWQKPMVIDIPQSNEGGHGGGDAKLLRDVFEPGTPDPLKRAASHLDGSMSILTGIAANICFETGQAVDIPSLVKFPQPQEACV